MKPPGYDQEISTPGAYEAWLDWQDAHVSIDRSRVVVKFEQEYVIELRKIDSLTKVLIEAFKLLSHLELNEPSAHARHIAVHFLRLVRKPLKLPHFTAGMFEELLDALVVTPRQPADKPEA